MVEAITLDALGQCRRNRIDLANGIFGMLGCRPGQVGYRIFGVEEGMPIVAPDPPAFDQHEGQHHDRHEAQYQAEQGNGAALASHGERSLLVLPPACCHYSPLCPAPYRP